jgi:hypothetical protein
MCLARIRVMTNPEEHLPLELDTLEARLRAARPVASDQTLKVALTRASGVRTHRPSSLLWSATPPIGGANPRLGVGVAAAAATLASAGGATIFAASASAMPSTITPICPAGTVAQIQSNGYTICVRT